MHYFILLILLLTIKAFFAMGLIYSTLIGLGPDEAQYWTWSQALDWGYYSKPPGIAWQIWLGTQLFGNTELGVRSASILISTFLSISVYFLARAATLSPKVSFWAAIIMAFCPIGLAASFLATTDGGMVLFWTLAGIPMASALSQDKTPNYYLIGAMILFGALFKWPIYFLWIPICVFGLFYPKLRSFHMIGGIALSLIGLFPSFVWNYSHNWATFRHVSATMQGGPKREFIQGNFFDFIGAQAALLSPIWFVLLLASFVYMIKNYKKMPRAVIFCGFTSLTILVAYSLSSIFQKIQGNWCVFTYPFAIVLLSWFACDYSKWGKRWVQAGYAVSLLMIIAIISFAVLPIPFRLNPFKHNLGWSNLSNDLIDAGYDPQSHFLFSDKYQMSSILSFYGPEQKRAYFLNLSGIRKNQFSYWPSMSEEQLGKKGFFVITENSPHLEKYELEKANIYQTHLDQYFSTVTYLGVKPLVMSNEKIVKGALIFSCNDYNGNTPIDPDIF